MKAIVLADGDAPDRAALDAAWPGWADGAEVVIAADGGARHADGLQLAVDAWVGDGDSIAPDALDALAARGVTMRRTSAAKDESDTELAVLEALTHDPTEILIIGALGGVRFDHSLANVGLLAMPQLAGRVAALLDARTRIRLISAPDAGGSAVRMALPGRVDDLVSLLPFGERVEGITTSGLRYPLRDEPLEAGPARGLSNVRERDDAWISVRRGRLLIVESPATLAR